MSDFERISFYDNTNQFERFAVIEDGNLVVLVEDVPKWFEKVKLPEPEEIVKRLKIFEEE